MCNIYAQYIYTTYVGNIYRQYIVLNQVYQVLTWNTAAQPVSTVPVPCNRRLCTATPQLSQCLPAPLLLHINKYRYV